MNCSLKVFFTKMVLLCITPFETFIIKSVFHQILCKKGVERLLGKGQYFVNYSFLFSFQAPFLIQIMF